MVHNGITYSTDDSEVIRVLDWARGGNALKPRLRITYGDTDTGRSWGDAPTEGYVSSSMGPQRIPILVYNRRAYGGAAILDSCIVRIEYANKRRGGVLYQHLYA